MAGSAEAVPASFVAHAAVMIAAWSLLAPLGAAVPSLGPRKTWFKWHRGIMAAGTFLTIVGFVLAYTGLTARSSIAPHFENTHAKIGLAVTAVSIFQALLGFFRPHKPEDGAPKTAGRKMFEVTHKRVIGPSLLVLAVANLFLGVTEYKEMEVGGSQHKSLRTAVIVLLAMSVVAMIIMWRRNVVNNERKVLKDTPKVVG